MLVSAIIVQGPDPAGNVVDTVYAKNPPDYAVYRTGYRVMVCYADDSDRAKAQSVALAALTPLRDEIAGLIDGWHADEQKQDKADGFDRRVAGALGSALQGDIVDAQLLLERVRGELVAERASLARFQYLFIASLCALAILILGWIGLSATLAPKLYPGADAAAIRTALGGGTLGAFFSIAIGIRGRTILADMRFRDNATDAGLRMLIGAIAAGLALCLQRVGLVTIMFDSGRLPAGTGPDTVVFLIGFIAGFSERLVPDLLAKATLAIVPGQVAVEGKAPKPAAVSAAASLADPAPPAEDDGETIDACPCDQPPLPGESETGDHELPAASGGIEGDAPDPDAPAGDDPCLCDVPPLAGEAETPDRELPAAAGGIAP